MPPRKSKKARVGASSSTKAAGSGTSAAAAAAASAAAANQQPAPLYGLYSTAHVGDYCSGAWFPISYVGPAPEQPGAAAAAASSSSSSSPAPSGDVLVRWQSKLQKYSPERLSLAFVRGGTEFVPLPPQHMRIGKRVLVRDVLEDLDFSGVSFWLATLKSEPPASVLTPLASAAANATATAAAGGKKRSSAGLSKASISVEYQNTMWPATAVPLSSIYVLPKVKGELNLVPAADEEAGEEAEDDESDEEDETKEGSAAAAAATRDLSSPSSPTPFRTLPGSSLDLDSMLPTSSPPRSGSNGQRAGTQGSPAGAGKATSQLTDSDTD